VKIRETTVGLLDHSTPSASRPPHLGATLDAAARDLVTFRREVGALRRENDRLRARIAALATRGSTPRDERQPSEPSIYLG